MHVRPLDPANKGDVKRWVKFPFDLYRSSKQWIPRMLDGEKAALDPQRHPFYQHSSAVFLVAESEGQVLGRVALINNRRYNQHHASQTGFFGFFEVVDDLQVARSLLEAVERWAQDRGFNLLLGPRGLIGSEADGILVEGFEHRPALNVPWNFPYYDRFLKDSGFEKDRDSLSGYISTAEVLPERIQRIAELVRRRRGFEIISFSTRAELRAMAPQVASVHQQAFNSGYGYVPLSPEEYAWATADLIAIADPRLIKLVMKDEQIVGFIFAYADIGDGLKRAGGRLFPFGWLHILHARRSTDWVNVNGIGILPEYQGLGVNAMLYAEVAQSILEFDFQHVDTVLIGEENFNSYSDQLSIGVALYKRHRQYRKSISSS